MKKSIKFYCLMMTAFFAVGLIMTANAQRGYRNYGRGYRGGYSYRSPVMIGHSYARVFGPRYYGLPHGSISIMFGGNPYSYFGGSFYRPYGGYYRSVFPPIGIHIGVLPYGCAPIYIGPDLYYFYNGIYYRHGERDYEVVDAPMGAQLSSLPHGAKSVMVNGEKFYELNGTYYKEDRDSKGKVVYTVVGKNGEINNTEELLTPPAGAKMGDKVPQLPPNCKSIMLNGEKLYVSPDDTYYKQEADGNFTIVGLPNSATL